MNYEYFSQILMGSWDWVAYDVKGISMKQITYNRILFFGEDLFLISFWLGKLKTEGTEHGFRRFCTPPNDFTMSSGLKWSMHTHVHLLICNNKNK
jgi:hypothetical protein